MIEVAIVPAGLSGEDGESAVEIVVTQGEAQVLTCEGQEIELTAHQPAARISQGIGEACLER